MNLSEPKPVTLSIDPRAIQSALKFLARSELRGHEAAEFNATVAALNRGLIEQSQPAAPVLPSAEASS